MRSEKGMEDALDSGWYAPYIMNIYSIIKNKYSVIGRSWEASKSGRPGSGIFCWKK